MRKPVEPKFQPQIRDFVNVTREGLGRVEGMQEGLYQVRVLKDGGSEVLSYTSDEISPAVIDPAIR